MAAWKITSGAIVIVIEFASIASLTLDCNVFMFTFHISMFWAGTEWLLMGEMLLFCQRIKLLGNNKFIPRYIKFWLLL